jgi:hypothetical protein
MDSQDKRKQIAAEIFTATGAKVDGYDPLVIAALFYSEHLRAAGDAVAVRLESAATDLRAASNLASSANSLLVADRSKLLKDIEAHVARCVKQANEGQSSLQDFRYIPIRFAIGGAFVAAVAMAIALMIGFERGSAQAGEAAVGRSFSRVVPELDPKVRDHLMEHLRKKAG